MAFAGNLAKYSSHILNSSNLDMGCGQMLLGVRLTLEFTVCQA